VIQESKPYNPYLEQEPVATIKVTAGFDQVNDQHGVRVRADGSDEYMALSTDDALALASSLISAAKAAIAKDNS
jgi:hypothetical protein